MLTRAFTASQLLTKAIDLLALDLEPVRVGSENHSSVSSELPENQLSPNQDFLAADLESLRS